MIGRFFGRKARMYLTNKLNEGHHELVYGLSSYWGSAQGLGRYGPFYDAAWFVQERLIREFDYHECSRCHWATTKPHTSWCAEQRENKNEKERALPPTENRSCS